MRIDFAGELNLFHLNDGLVLLGFLFPLVFFKAELAVIDGTAYRGGCRRRNHHKIHAVIVRVFECLSRRHDTDLFSVHTDQADFFHPNIFIDQGFSRICSCYVCILHKKMRTNFVRTKTKHAPRVSCYEPYAPVWYGENEILLDRPDSFEYGLF